MTLTAAVRGLIVDPEGLRGLLGVPEGATGMVAFAPALLLVGSLDGPVIAMNRRAYNAIQSERRPIIVEGAGRLFPEAGTIGPGGSARDRLVGTTARGRLSSR